jgi:hypothetical protein
MCPKVNRKVRSLLKNRTVGQKNSKDKDLRPQLLRKCRSGGLWFEASLGKKLVRPSHFFL